MRSPAARRSFRLLWTGQTVNIAGTWVSSVALPLVAVDRLHASTFDVGLLEAMQWIPAVLIGLPVGALADRCRPRLLMMGANLGQAAATAAVPLTAAFGALTLTVLLGAATAAGFFGVFFQTAYSPYIREVVDPDDLTVATARLQAGQSAAKVSGPSIAGVLVATIGAANTVIADAASFIVCFAALLMSEPGAAKKAPLRQPMGKQIAEGLRHLKASSLLVTLTACTASANFFLTAIGAIEIVFLVRAVNVPAWTIGLLFTISGTGGLLGAIFATKLSGHVDTFTVARRALALTAPFAVLIPLAHHGPAVILFAIGGFIVTFGLTLVSVAFSSLRLLHCPPDLLGRITGASRLLSAASIPIGALLGAGLGQVLGTRTALLLLAVGYVGFSLAILRTPLRAPLLKDTAAPDTHHSATAAKVDRG